MRVAIPTFGQDISPRFCFATEMLVVEVVGHEVLTRKRVPLGDMSWSERLAVLQAHHVQVLLCGGFPKQYAPVAAAAGIQVTVGLAGSSRHVLEAYLRGHLEDCSVGPSMGRESCTRPGNRRRGER